MTHLRGDAVPALGPWPQPIGDAFYSPWESTVTRDQGGTPQHLDAIRQTILRFGNKRDVAWRGVADASWSLHSSLYRYATTLQNDPKDDHLVKLEHQILDEARSAWRYDSLGALELLAHLQHYGAPTRLLDVSFNPLIALWFACEQQVDTETHRPLPDSDARLFAFDVTHRQVQLDDYWGGRSLPWGDKANPPLQKGESAEDAPWKTRTPYVWKPPSYNARIPAQNSAFLLAGVPVKYGNPYIIYRRSPGQREKDDVWSIIDVRRASSIPVALASVERKPREGSTPAFTIRIPASMKAQIRLELERRYGYNRATMYPDLFGLATQLGKRVEDSSRRMVNS